MADTVISRLVGTFQSAFRIGTKGSQLRLKNTGGNLDLRDNGDAAYIGVTALWSQAMHYQPYSTSLNYTIPASHQAIFADEVSGTGTITIVGQLCVVG